MVLPKKKLTKFVFVNFSSILYHYSPKSIKNEQLSRPLLRVWRVQQQILP
jgi:hypothetical protein